MVELVVLVLLGLSCFGIVFKCCLYQCDNKYENDNDNNIIEIPNFDNEVPPKYEDI